ncbi:MAG: hypothetical protein Q7T70_18880 [Polaromonas sp.]|nr:hypothetical protein [Polaromonas sp.]
MFKKIIVITLLGFAGSAFAQDATCTANATQKSCPAPLKLLS